MDSFDEALRRGGRSGSDRVLLVGRQRPDRVFPAAADAVISENGRVERPPAPGPWDTIVDPSGAAIPALPPRDGKHLSYYRGGRPKATAARRAAIREQQRRDAHGKR